MPVIVVDGRFRLKIFGPPREHPPPHAHVEHGPTGVPVIRIGRDGAPPVVWEAYDMKDRDIVRALELVHRHAHELLQAWERLHGPLG